MGAVESLLSQPVVQQIGWVLVHFLWQGVAIALLLACGLHVMRRHSPQARWLGVPPLSALAVGVAVAVTLSGGCGGTGQGDRLRAMSLTRNGNRTIHVGQQSREVAWHVLKAEQTSIGQKGFWEHLPRPEGTEVVYAGLCGSLQWSETGDMGHDLYGGTGFQLLMPYAKAAGPHDVAIRRWAFDDKEAAENPFLKDRYYAFCFDAQLKSDGRSDWPAVDLGAVLPHLTAVIAIVPVEDGYLDDGLVEAARMGDVQGALRAIDAGADLNARDVLGETALHVAARSIRPSMVTTLLERGATVDTKDAEGATPLMRALVPSMAADTAGGDEFRDQLTTVTILLRHGANVNAAGPHGSRPLHWAAMNGPLELAQLLLAAGADVNLADDNGVAVLHMVAAWAGSEYYMKYLRLLLACGADPNKADKQGRTPLDVAIENGLPGVVDVLRQSGAKASSPASKAGAEVHTLTWTGYNGMQPPEVAVYVLDGKPMGQGEQGFRRVLAGIEKMDQGAVLMVFPDYSGLTTGGEPPRIRPYLAYEHDLTAAAERRGVAVKLAPAAVSGVADVEQGNRGKTVPAAGDSATAQTAGDRASCTWTASWADGDKPGAAIVLHVVGRRVVAGEVYILDPDHPRELQYGIGYPIQNLRHTGNSINGTVAAVNTAEPGGITRLEFKLVLTRDLQEAGPIAEVSGLGGLEASEDREWTFRCNEPAKRTAGQAVPSPISESDLGADVLRVREVADKPNTYTVGGVTLEGVPALVKHLENLKAEDWKGVLLILTRKQDEGDIVREVAQVAEKKGWAAYLKGPPTRKDLANPDAITQISGALGREEAIRLATTKARPDGIETAAPISRELAEVIAKAAFRGRFPDDDLAKYTVDVKDSESEWEVVFELAMPRPPGTGLVVYVSKALGAVRVFENE